MLSKKKNNWYALAFPAILLVFSILACDSGGSDKKTPPDTTAPAMIELDSLSAETTTITFTWNDPADSDFDHLEVTCLGATETVAAGTQACTITGLSADTRYEVSAASADTTGNVSEAVVFSVTTPAAGSIAYSILYTEDELDNVRNNLSGNYFLMVDLDLSSYESWTPLGDVSTAFTGVFHGNGHTISHLTITGSDDRQGLFGNVTGGEITGLGLIEVNVSGDDSVGGLVGYTYGYSTISDCYATGTVTGSSDNVGGLVGSSYTVIVSGCYAACEVNGSSYVGGLMGRSSNGGTISDCYASGGVTGSSYTGGLVGIISNNSTVNSTVVSNCYATGSVEGSSSVGGLVGWLYSSCTYPPGCTPMGCIVSGCYATGAVTGFSNVGGLVGDNEGYNEIYDCYTAGSVEGSSNVGGLVGSNNTTSTVSNCFYDSETSGYDNAGGSASSGWTEEGTAKTTAHMQTVVTFTETDTVGLTTPWDFVDNPNDDVGTDDIWDIDPLINGGYPCLTGLADSY